MHYFFHSHLNIEYVNSRKMYHINNIIQKQLRVINILGELLGCQINGRHSIIKEA